MKRLMTAALVCLPLALAASAQADSISFLRSGDIWVAAPDGTRQTQLTHDGGYSYQSRADDGSFIALHGRNLRRLSPTGDLIAEFSTPVSAEQTAPKTAYFVGPFKPEISPDGSKVAYEYRFQDYYTDPRCGTADFCTDTRLSVGIGYTYPDRLTSWDEPGLGRQSGWIDPSWIDNSTLLQSDKSVRPNVDAIIDHPGDGNQTIERWFEDDKAAWYLRDGEVSRRGDAVAFLTTTPRDWSDSHIGQQDDQITIYRLSGAPPAQPEHCFSFGNPDAIYASPSFAPDGAQVAWASRARETAGAWEIRVGDVPSLAGGCQGAPGDSRTLIADAMQPDWSPAPVPGAARVEAAAAAAPPEAAPAAKAITVRVARRKLARALSRGLRVRLAVPAGGSLSVKATRAGTTVATASRRVKRAGNVSVTLRFTQTARRTLRRARAAKLRVTYELTPGSATLTR
jgi:hypothetical protein